MPPLRHDATITRMNDTDDTTTIAAAAVICRVADQPQAGGVRFALTSELTSGPLDIGTQTVARGGGPPMHIHHHQDEYVLVLSGSLRCRVGDHDIDLASGDAALLPRGLEHTFTNAYEEPCDIVWVFQPGGFHPFLAAVDEADTFDPAVLGPIAAQYGHELTGPPLAVLLGL